MVRVDATIDTPGRLSPHLRGHLLQFHRRPAPVHTAHAGARLLLAAALLEVVRLMAVTWLYPGIPLAMLLPLLLGLALLAVPGIAGVRLSQLGFPRWRDWSATEKSYFVQIIVLAAILLAVVPGSPLAKRGAQPGVMTSVFVPYLFFGFYQELTYRGMVQLELVRRWGAAAGIVAANVLYTFGPLHWYYFASRASLAVPMFASIFAIGLFFGVLYKRSGNLWIVATFHAIGNAYIVSSVGPTR
jgi:uncharacterized protein